MSLTELFPEVKNLQRVDKLRLMQFILVDLAEGEGIELLEAGAEYPVWTPFNAFEAAETLTDMLNRHKKEKQL